MTNNIIEIFAKVTKKQLLVVIEEVNLPITYTPLIKSQDKIGTQYYYCVQSDQPAVVGKLHETC